MKPKERAAMQAAWVWMDWYSSNNGTLEPVDFNETITALREALEQPDEIDWIETNKSLAKEIIELKKQAEQEPVMVVEVNQMGIPEITWDAFAEYSAGKYELYAEPVRTKDLTDDEIEKIFKSYIGKQYDEFARAVIAADREKNK